MASRVVVERTRTIAGRELGQGVVVAALCASSISSLLAIMSIAARALGSY